MKNFEEKLATLMNIFLIIFLLIFQNFHVNFTIFSNFYIIL